MKHNTKTRESMDMFSQGKQPISHRYLSPANTSTNPRCDVGPTVSSRKKTTHHISYFNSYFCKVNRSVKESQKYSRGYNNPGEISCTIPRIKKVSGRTTVNVQDLPIRPEIKVQDPPIRPEIKVQDPPIRPEIKVQDLPISCRSPHRQNTIALVSAACVC